MENKKYDPDVLKHLQNLELMILKDFIKICEDNDLKYFMYGGSLLGAVRHGGFIPWDDDIDVVMFRSDYEKFVEIFEKEQTNKYELLTIENNPTYFFLFSKLMLKGTKFEEWWYDQVDFESGIFMDIFILDDAPKNKILQKLHLYNAHILNRLIAISSIKFKDYPLLTQSLVNSLHSIFKLLKISPDFFKKKSLKVLKKYKNSDYIFNVIYIPHPVIFLRKDYLPAKKCKFEDIVVTIPNDFDKLLTMQYGDYMVLPPEEKRYNHVTANLDFGDY